MNKRVNLRAFKMPHSLLGFHALMPQFSQSGSVDILQVQNEPRASQATYLVLDGAVLLLHLPLEL